MRVLHLISGLQQGGAEIVLRRLCVASHGTIQHMVISLTDLGIIGPDLQSAGITVDHLGLNRGRFTVRGAWGLRRLIQHRKPDVIQTWMYHADLIGGLLGRQLGIPVVWGIRAAKWDPRETSLTTHAVIHLCAWLSRHLPRVITSCSQAAAIVHRGLGFSHDRMVVITNGYDVEAFRPDVRKRRELRARCGIPEDVSVVGMVGRWSPVKDHDTFLEAIRRVFAQGLAFQVVLVGSGLDDDNAELQALIARHGLVGHVQCMGRTDDVPAMMNLMDLHVLSSVSEGFPNVLAEAMACGTPCVTTAVGDAPDIVGSLGWVVAPRDPQALSEAIRAAVQERLQSPGAWRVRQSSCRQHITERFGIERMVQRFRVVWEAVAHPETRSLRMVLGGDGQRIAD